jgi:hypothetical protein
VDATRRLLRLARRRRSDPELFAGLTHTCRYCGLIEASLAAYDRASSLDPNVSTSVIFTWWNDGDYERIVAAPVLPQDRDIQTLALYQLGRFDEARAQALADEEHFGANVTLREFRRALRALIEGDFAAVLQSLDSITGLGEGAALAAGYPDGEAVHFVALLYARAGSADKAMICLRSAVDRGFHCLRAFDRHPWLEILHERGDFRQLLEELVGHHRYAASVFAAEDGPTILGVGAPSSLQD